MAPSNVTLNTARQIVGYNNEILVATENLTIGKMKILMRIQFREII